MEDKNRTSWIYFSFFVALAFLLYFGAVIAVEPFGANYTNEISSTAQPDAPQSIPAQAGNVTQLDIFGYTTTQSWQGYYGNVTGTIILADSYDKVLYNWSLAAPEGEVYASVNGSGEIDWGNVACFNMDNHLALETLYNISTDDVDGVNETFKTGNSHDPFYTAGAFFDTGTCASTQIFDASGQGNDNSFEEVLLTDASSPVQTIFASLLEEEDIVGFDGNYYDFEMIVLENGHGTDTAMTPYYFYVELQ
ncbi:hypothetical protein A3K73_05025 [Candidatus Pacearchaeota archaeon RBG_13_36_9]|nr:MAG: hypothetical protein A3K73_05025 [Candidatus Pacearchaeota archaeon RBG_13_36_9]